MKKLFAFIAIVLMAINAISQTLIPEPSLIKQKSSDHGMAKEIEALKQQLATDPSLQNREVFISDYIQQMKNQAGTGLTLPDTTCIVTIPVVFHVFNPYGILGVPLSQIDYAMNDLNITFAGTDADYGTVDPLFSSVKSYTKIRFARALTDPRGNATTGVVYYTDKQPGFGNDAGYDNEIASCAWDNYKYFNVYIMNDLYNDGSIYNSGICYYPSTYMSDAGIARMVYNYSYFGQGGSSYNYLEFNQFFTHEFGHFLNLYHTFEGSSCTGPGDYCADTPPADAAGAGCSASLCGAPINAENYMDYNSTCFKNFTMDQNTRMEAALALAPIQPLWQYDNLVATGVLDPLSANSCVTATDFFAYSKTKLGEDTANNGGIQMPPVIIYACAGAQFALNNTTLSAGIHYSITNVPAGLSVSIVTSSTGKSATMTFSGQAANHAAANSVNNIQLTFTNAAVIGGNVNTIQNYTKTFSISFIDPWQQTCETPNITTTAVSTWTTFETTGPIPRYYGLWYNSGNYYLENYGRGIITTSALSDNIQFLPAGTSIGATSAWHAGGGQGVLYSPAYTALDGTTGYLGFRMQAGNDYFYGWMKISVSSTAGITLLEYHYNEKPNTAIIAGSSCYTAINEPEEKSTDNSVSIYPNPFTSEATIAFVESQKNATIKITDALGKEIKTISFTGKQLTLEKGEMQKGIYFVQITNEKKNIFNRKIIIQ